MRRVEPQDLGLKFNGPIPLRSETNFFGLHHIGKIPKGMTAEDIDAAVIHRWHIERGFLGIAYNYIILPNGTIQRGRDRDALGAHCKGHNHESAGICVVGDFTKEKPTTAQFEALCDLLADLHEHYGLDASREQTIIGHRELVDTECPGDNLFNLIPAIRDRVVRLCR